MYSQSLSVAAPLLLFADGRAPGPVDADHVVRDLEVRTYYIANNSVQRPGWPALRVKSLTESRGAAQFRDEEILPGVEDLQVEIRRCDHGSATEPRTFLRAAGFAARTRTEPWSRSGCGCAFAPTPPNRDSTTTRPLTYANVSFTPIAAEVTAAPHCSSSARSRFAMRHCHETRHQRGATLVVGLMLLTLVTLLGLAGAATAHIEPQLAHNEQFRENAASAASAGIEVAISRIVTITRARLRRFHRQRNPARRRQSF